MSLKDQFFQLLEQLSYTDHELDLDVCGEITEVLSHAKAEGLSSNEIMHMVEDRVKLLKQSSVLEDPEQIRLVDELLERLPDVLALS
jgi:hypothetical protein